MMGYRVFLQQFLDTTELEDHRFKNPEVFIFSG